MTGLVFIVDEKASTFFSVVTALETFFDRVTTVPKYFDLQFIMLFTSPFEGDLAAYI